MTPRPALRLGGSDPVPKASAGALEAFRDGGHINDEHESRVGAWDVDRWALVSPASRRGSSSNVHPRSRAAASMWVDDTAAAARLWSSGPVMSSVTSRAQNPVMDRGSRIESSRTEPRRVASRGRGKGRVGRETSCHTGLDGGS